MTFFKCFFSTVSIFTTLALLSQNIYLKQSPPEIKSDFDRFLSGMWKKGNITPTSEATDSVMVRRLYIDLVGRVPSPAEARAYIGDKNPDKQSLLVKKLLESEECAMFMTMRMGDELRIKSEFPINLWPNAAYLYSRIIYDALRTNIPFDRFAAALLLSDGSNFRNGYANFFRAVPQKRTLEISDAAARFLLSKSFSMLSKQEQTAFTSAFANINFKSTREWKEEIVFSTLPPAKDPRFPFVKEILAGDDFARTTVKRIWRWIFGSDNVDPLIVDYLAGVLRKNNFNLRDLMFNICTSAAYRVGSLTNADYAVMTKAGAVYPIRRLDAEVLADSIAQITGTTNSYVSVIPEPFSYYKGRAAALPDGSVTDQFLLLFGRPSRDTGLPEERKSVITADQRLYLFNSANLNNRLNNIHRTTLQKEKDKFAGLYMLFYSRMPTAEERKYFAQLTKKHKFWPVFSRMPWVLLNSKEFLYQH